MTFLKEGPWGIGSSSLGRVWILTEGGFCDHDSCRMHVKPVDLASLSPALRFGCYYCIEELR